MDIQSIDKATQPNAVVGERATRVPDAPTAAKPSVPPVVANAIIKQPDPAANSPQVTAAVKSINKALQSKSQTVEFSVDEDSNRTIVKVVDQTTKTVIRQIPTGEVLEIAKALDQAKGLLFSQKA